MSGPVADADPTLWDLQFTINLRTAFITTREFLPLLRNGGGSIVYFAAAAALPGAPTANMSAYVASKAALLAFMKTVAEEESVNGVRCNAIAPTSMRTSTNQTAMGANADYVELEDVASTVGFLISGEAAAVTGQVIRLQGFSIDKAED